MPCVFTNGCFDLFHAGHIQLLLFCRSLAGCDPLYVAIDSDKKIKRDKGKGRPYITESERQKALFNLTMDGNPRDYGRYIVDWVHVFDTNKELKEIIKQEKPDIIVKGNDWKGKRVIGQEKAQVIFAPDFYKDLFSTTVFEERIRSK
jgi:cytidyltransferase-like protein